VVEKYYLRVDVTEKYPYLDKKLSPFTTENERAFQVLVKGGDALGYYRDVQQKPVLAQRPENSDLEKERSTHMNMRMPGFTADPAVYNSGGLMYGMAGAMDAPAQGAVVTPQALFCRTVFNGCRVGVCVRVQLCLIPPSACLRVRVAGITVFDRCIP